MIPEGFITLDVLARELGMSLDNVRYRFKQLRRSNHLVDGVDYIRDDYVNETNFVYRLNPTRFYLEAGFALLAGGRSLASTSLLAASESPSSPDMGSSSNASDTPSGIEATAGGSLASTEVLRERLAFKDEQIGWKQEQLEETRGELATLREERRMFTRALTSAFETIQGLNSQLMTLAAPADRGAIASGGSSRASGPASEGHLDADENASEVIHLSSDHASDDDESFLATP